MEYWHTDSINALLASIFNDLDIALATYIVQNHSSHQLLCPVFSESSTKGIIKYSSN